jgi:crotonobetainyl-CoA:carnitine CoA-transferase CaiB-like acyl-CoA transferase
MKKTFLALLVSLLVSTFSFAQTADTTHKKELTKEEKAAIKAKSEAEVMQAYKEAGLTDAQIASCKEAVDAANQKSNELKKQTTLSDDEKAAAKKIITDEKNAKMKEIMGADAYKKYSDVRKAQKASAAIPQ